ncbi:MAG: hypothetical protein ABWY78_16435, partial [Microvirga sp.]
MNKEQGHPIPPNADPAGFTFAHGTGRNRCNRRVHRLEPARSDDVTSDPKAPNDFPAAAAIH